MILKEAGNIYYILGIIMSMAIVVFFAISTIYGILYQIKEKYKPFNNWLYLYITAVGFLWVLAYGYVLINDIAGIQILCASSFGGIFLRPIMVLTGAGTAISQKLRFEAIKKDKALKKYEMEKQNE